MCDRHFRDPLREAGGESRNEERVLAPAQHPLHDLATVGSQHATVIARRRAATRRYSSHHARGYPPWPRIFAALANTADDVVALGDLGEQLGDFFGWVLQVGVERDHDLAARHLEAREHRPVLARVVGELDKISAGSPRPSSSRISRERSVEPSST